MALLSEGSRRSRGSALVLALGVVLVLMGLALAYSDTVLVHRRVTDDLTDTVQADAIAQAGIDYAANELRTGKDYDGQGVGANSADFNGGHYDVSSTTANGYTKIICTAAYNKTTRKLEALLHLRISGIYWYAIFAGNGQGSTSYNMLFDGTGDQGDNVVGAVYSGNNVTIAQGAAIRNARPSDPNYNPAQNAAIGGDVKSAGALSNSNGGIQGQITQGHEVLPDLGQFKYEQNAKAAFNGDKTLAQQYVDVADELKKYGKTGTWWDSGSAVQITDANNPAHIFRKNPSDRRDLRAASGVDNYFLEDPTSTKSSQLNSGTDEDASYNGSNAVHVNVTTSSDPTREGSGKIYFIDGNLWINNLNAYSFVLKNNEANGVKMTFVVKGNIYFGDNLFYNNINKDGVAFIALHNDALETSGPGSTGNIYLGDPVYGTIRRLESYLYAENNFVDCNLDESGSQQFTILGNMTAGNLVTINRDFTGPGHYETQKVWDPKKKKYVNQRVWVPGPVTHSRMDVLFDGRVRDNEIFRKAMPGIPLPGNSTGGWEWCYTRLIP